MRVRILGGAHFNFGEEKNVETQNVASSSARRETQNVASLRKYRFFPILKYILLNGLSGNSLRLWQNKRMCATNSSKISPSLEAESRFWTQGLRYVAGVHEVGRGPWAGPVFAAAVVLPATPDGCAALAGVRDSKMLSALQRERLTLAILATAVAAAVGRAEAGEIDAVGIVPATRLAMQRALAALVVAPEALIIDALTLPGIPLPQDAFPCADARSLSVAAASILAKTRRDAWMATVAEAQFPGYGFAQHKGYGTRQHQAALARQGVTPLHRRSFRPIAERLAAKRENDSAL